MFNSVNNLSDAVRRFDAIKDANQFDSTLVATRELLKNLNMFDEARKLESIAFYNKNEFSEKNNNDNAKEASKRVIQYIEELVQGAQMPSDLKMILDKFELFLDCLINHEPNKKATIQESIKNLEINNEYDLQHILYAYLKPLYETARLEVADDTGYGFVRYDIFVGTESVIEAKCTRDSMTLKGLQEEISSDITQYAKKNIYFYIYDKNKLIDNPQVFKQKYETILNEKNVYVTIVQPRVL